MLGSGFDYEHHHHHHHHQQNKGEIEPSKVVYYLVGELLSSLSAHVQKEQTKEAIIYLKSMRS